MTASDGRSWIDDLAVQRTGLGGVILTPEAMDVDRPYPYLINGAWFAAVKRADGAIDLYRFDRRSLVDRLRAVLKWATT